MDAGPVHIQPVGNLMSEHERERVVAVTGDEIAGDLDMTALEVQQAGRQKLRVHLFAVKVGNDANGERVGQPRCGALGQPALDDEAGRFR